MAVLNIPNGTQVQATMIVRPGEDDTLGGAIEAGTVDLDYTVNGRASVTYRMWEHVAGLLTGAGLDINNLDQTTWAKADAAQRWLCIYELARQSYHAHPQGGKGCEPADMARRRLDAYRLKACKLLHDLNLKSTDYCLNSYDCAGSAVVQHCE